MSDENVLTKEIAELFLADEDSVDLSEFTAIDDDAAEAIATTKRWLKFTNIKSLSDTAAKHLAKHRNRLWLTSLETLSDNAAQDLSESKCGLWLQGLRELSAKAARYLAYCNGELRIETDEWPDAAREAFCYHRTTITQELVSGYLDGRYKQIFQGRTSMEDKAADLLISNHDDTELEDMFWCVESISDAVAASLSNLKGNLELDGLTSISDAVAASLSNLKGNLKLDGLTSISDAAAASLSNAKGNLGLNGLTSITDSAADSLSNIDGELGVNGVTVLSDASAKSFSKLIGRVELSSLRDISYSGMQMLGLVLRSGDVAEHAEDDYIQLDQLAIDDDAAKMLSVIAAEELTALHLVFITDSAAEWLSQFKGDLSIHLDDLPQSAAAILRKHPSFADED